MLFVRICEAYIKGITRIIVRTARAATVRCPLVSTDTDIYTDRVYSKCAWDIENAVIGFRICKFLITLLNMSIFGCRCT